METSKNKDRLFEDIELKNCHVPTEMLLRGREQIIPFGEKLRQKMNKEHLYGVKVLVDRLEKGQDR